VATSGAHVVEHDISMGRWTRATWRSRPSLRWLLHREHVGFHQRTSSFQRWLEPPQPALTLIVDLEGSLRVDGTDLPAAWIGGLSEAPTLVEHGGAYASIDVKLTPLGAHGVLGGLAMHELTNTIAPLEAVFGQTGARLAERVVNAHGWTSRFELIDAFVAERFESGPRPSAGVAWAWSRLLESGGRARIEMLARELGWSRRRLATEFRAQVGLAPKTVARLIRFEDLRRRLDHEPVRWADVAYECGYCDQSHLCRDFRDLAGTTPGEFLARRIPGGGVIGDGAHLSKTKARVPA
jgi:AraC-like DNA-binding protein